MRNAILALLAVCVLATSADALPFLNRKADESRGLLTFRRADAEPQPAAIVPQLTQPAIGQINGTAPLNQNADTVYTVLCLPRNYRVCGPCLKVLNAFNTDRDLIDLRGQTNYYVLVEGTPQWTPAWAARVPEVAAGHTVALLTQGAKEIAREVSPNLVGFGDRFKKKFCDKICPECTPEPVEPLPEEPDTTIQPPPVQPLEPAAEVNKPVAFALLGLTGLCVYGLFFRHRMNS